MLRSAEELRKSQERALRGSGGKDLQDRLDKQRHAVRALARLGRDILGDEGRSVSDAIVERIAKTLDAAALDEGSRFQLRAGRLTDELEPPGFEALVGLAPPNEKPAAQRKRQKGSVAEARAKLQAAQREARARAREAVKAEDAVDRAEAAAAEARRTAQAARERSDEADRALAEAEAALREVQS